MKSLFLDNQGLAAKHLVRLIPAQSPPQRDLSLAHDSGWISRNPDLPTFMSPSPDSLSPPLCCSLGSLSLSLSLSPPLRFSPALLCFCAEESQSQESAASVTFQLSGLFFGSCMCLLPSVKSETQPVLAYSVELKRRGGSDCEGHLEIAHSNLALPEGFRRKTDVVTTSPVEPEKDCVVCLS